MTDSADLRSLKDDELLTRTHDLARREQALTLEVMAHLNEIERRRLYAARGYSSLFEYCTQALGYGGGAGQARAPGSQAGAGDCGDGERHARDRESVSRPAGGRRHCSGRLTAGI